MSLRAESLIIDYLKNKSKHLLRSFECDNCHQMYYYIVEEGTDKVKCNICDEIMIAKGD